MMSALGFCAYFSLRFTQADRHYQLEDDNLLIRSALSLFIEKNTKIITSRDLA